jgi:hypothetical protein
MANWGNYNRPTWGRTQEFSGGMTQKGILVTCPAAGQITRCGGWMAGTSGSNTAGFAIWDYATGALLAQTGTFSIAIDGGGPPYGARYEADLISPLSVTNGQDIIVGPFCTPGANGWEYPVNASGSGTHYEKKVTPPPGSMSGYGSQPYLAGFYCIATLVEDLATLTVSTASAPSVTFSWNASTIGSPTYYALAVCQKVANSFMGFDYNTPDLTHCQLASVAIGTTTVTLNLTGLLFPGDWVWRVFAVDNSGNIYGQTNTSFPTVTIASPSPYPWGASEFWFNSSGALQYTAAFKAWYVASQFQVNQPFATRFATGTQVN